LYSLEGVTREKNLDSFPPVRKRKKRRFSISSRLKKAVCEEGGKKGEGRGDAKSFCVLSPFLI